MPVASNIQPTTFDISNQQTFVRKSLKFVIPFEHVPQLKQALKANLGVFTLTLTSGLVITSQIIHNCYLDNEELSQYHDRVQKLEGAKLVRIRWYGKKLSDSTVFIERKKHHNAYAKALGKESNKRRFSIDLKLVDPYLKGHVCPKDSKIAASIQTLIITHRLRPMIHTEYTRTAYQNENVKHLRITVDENISCFLEPDNWATIEGRNGVPQGRTIKAPFAICEVKISFPKQSVTGKARGHFPNWLKDALNNTGVTKLKISKYHFGCIFLKPETSRNLPYWAEPLHQLYPSLPDPHAPILKSSICSNKLRKILQGQGLVAVNGMARAMFPEESCN